MPRNKIIPYHPELRKVARILRRNSTLSEILLWEEIRKRKLGVQFHRQVPMDTFIVDFYCHELMLAIEIDGDSHDNPQQATRDRERRDILEAYGVRFIRIDDRDIKSDFDSVMRYLSNTVQVLIRAKDKSPLEGR